MIAEGQFRLLRGRDMTTLGMTVTLGGEQMLITDLRVIDKQWVSGDRRFTPKEKELLTAQARAIIAEDEAFRKPLSHPASDLHQRVPGGDCDYWRHPHHTAW